MITTEQKQELEKLTGVPAELLTGDTIEENLALAKALNAYKNEYNSAPKDTSAKGQFAAWLESTLNKSDLDDLTDRLTEAAGAKNGNKN